MCRRLGARLRGRDDRVLPHPRREAAHPVPTGPRATRRVDSTRGRTPVLLTILTLAVTHRSPACRRSSRAFQHGIPYGLLPHSASLCSRHEVVGVSSDIAISSGTTFVRVRDAFAQRRRKIRAQDAAGCGRCSSAPALYRGLPRRERVSDPPGSRRQRDLAGAPSIVPEDIFEKVRHPHLLTTLLHRRRAQPRRPRATVARSHEPETTSGRSRGVHESPAGVSCCPRYRRVVRDQRTPGQRSLRSAASRPPPRPPARTSASCAAFLAPSAVRTPPCRDRSLQGWQRSWRARRGFPASARGPSSTISCDHAHRVVSFTSRDLLS